MNELAAGAGLGVWLGALTSISPCPLASNIAAVSYVGRQAGSARKVLLAGVLYTAGRSVAYAVVGALIVSSALEVPFLANLLQRHMNRFIGPVLILASLLMLNVVRINLRGFGMGRSLQRRIDRMGLAGAAVLGVLFALSFCPLSAALFFGTLIPLAVKLGSGLLLPITYGIGTGIPVLAFALLLAAGARRLAGAFNAASRIEVWGRRVTGGVFALVGVYYTLVFLAGVSL